MFAALAYLPVDVARGGWFVAMAAILLGSMAPLSRFPPWAALLLVTEAV